MMIEGWLLDLYADLVQGVKVWVLGSDGMRYQFSQAFPVKFFAHGTHDDLRALWLHLRASKEPVSLARRHKENSAGELLDVMEIAVNNPAYQPRLLNRVIRRFPQLDYYDTDIPLSLRFSATHSVFPFAKCHVQANQNGIVEQIEAIDSRWDPDPEPLPFRVLDLALDTDPYHEQPTSLRASQAGRSVSLDFGSPKHLLHGLNQIIDGWDPDFIISNYGDTWLFPFLFHLSQKHQILFNPNRDKELQPRQMKEKSYVQYGRVMYRGQQTHLYGRFHIDRHNAMTYGEYGIPGAIKQSRVTGVPIQEMARKSPGAGITAMFMLTSQKRGSIYPHVKQHVEMPKDLLQLDLADNGGLVYKPKIGFFTNVIQIDFSSMYPSIMSLWNVSPETVGVTSKVVRKVPEIDFPIDQQRKGLVAETLEPLLKLRLELKGRLKNLDPESLDYKRTLGESTALKWLLVVCFGYQGYKRFREGRIEAHETITAISRQIMLQSKEIAEQSGYEVLHMYVDGLWIRRLDGKMPSKVNIDKLLSLIEESSGLPIEIEAMYKWVAFLASRQDKADPVPNRYYGALIPEGYKVRGISSRRHDTPKFISDAELEALEAMSRVEDPTNSTEMIKAVVNVIQDRLKGLEADCFPISDYLIHINISRELSQYKVSTPAVRAGRQLESEGRKLKAGQRVRFVYSSTEDGVLAWDLPDHPSLLDLDRKKYSDLLIRMGAELVAPFGMTEEQLALKAISQAKALQFSDLIRKGM